MITTWPRIPLSLCAEEATDPEVKATCLYDLAQIQADLHNTAKAEGLLAEIMAAPDVSKERKALAGLSPWPICTRPDRSWTGPKSCCSPS